jgi:glutamyl-tRNA reductase
MSVSSMDQLYGAFITHKRASLSAIEAISARDRASARANLRTAGAEEAFVLQTCNRAEFYVHGPRESLEAALAEADVHGDAIQRASGIDVARHAYRVAAGLESMVVGEDEILGQFTEAVEDARDDLGGTLEEVLDGAIHTGKRVRNETRINQGNPSMGTAAAELASRAVGELAEARALVVGAGEMGRLIAKPLSDRGADVIVTNRTYQTARDLAEEVDGRAVCFDGISSRFGDVDLVVTATDAPHRIFEAEDFAGVEAVVVDLASPRDVDKAVAEQAGVDVFDIDDVGAIVDTSQQLRHAARERAEEIIEDALSSLQVRLKQQRADEMLSQIYRRAEEIRAAETERALERLEADNGYSNEEILDDFATSIVNQLLSTPTHSIKEAAASEDYQTLEAVANVFEVPCPAEQTATTKTNSDD